MVLRIFGLKEEYSYGEAFPLTGTITPDWHQNINKGSFELNDEAITMSGGERMTVRARPGAIKPSGSIEAYTDLKRIGHIFKAFLDNYAFTADEGDPDEDGTANAGINLHEFWGGNSQDLTSFKGVVTFDMEEKLLSGLVLDGMKLEVAGEAMTIAEDWLYKTQKINSINENTYIKREFEGDIPVMFYDVHVELDGDVPPGVCSSFTFEGKNNLSQDSCIGLGSRVPQIKPQAQKRDISVSLVSTLRNETIDLIRKAEHGENSPIPSECKLYKLDLKITIQICEQMDDKLVIYFPQCLVNVEYEASESDEIETTFNLSALGTGEVTLSNGNKVVTDMYVKLENDQPEISSS